MKRTLLVAVLLCLALPAKAGDRCRVEEALAQGSGLGAFAIH